MPANENYIVVIVTASSQEEANRISDVLLKKRLIACANIVSDVQSLFWWKGKLDRSAELMLILKSRGELLGEIIRVVKENHSYEVPEVVALPILGGNPDYLCWIDESIKSRPKGARA